MPLDAKTPELARHYERETAKQTMTAKPVRVFLTQRFPLDPHFDPHLFQRFRNKKASKTEVFDAFLELVV